MERDEELINAIAPDVLVALRRERFFESLDDRICPAGPARVGALCDGTYAITTAILVKAGFDEEAITDVLLVLAAKGACCDCEILFNVAEESRLKSEYWKKRAAEAQFERHTRHSDR
jgi:hypothetical protein